MVVVPATRPDTLPELSTVPDVGLLLLQVPPVVASVSAVVKPWHTFRLPVIADNGLTVTMAVT